MTTGLYAFGFVHDLFPQLYLLLGTALILKAAYGEGLLKRIFMHPWLQALGKISYSFYLLHAAVCMLFFHLAHRYLPSSWKLLVAAASIPLVFGITWIAAAAMYKIAEEPYFRKRHGSRETRSTKSAVLPQSASSQTVP